MKKNKVILTEQALQDMLDIYNYIAQNDSEKIAKKIYELRS